MLLNLTTKKLKYFHEKRYNNNKKDKISYPHELTFQWGKQDSKQVKAIVMLCTKQKNKTWKGHMK